VVTIIRNGNAVIIYKIEMIYSVTEGFIWWSLSGHLLSLSGHWWSLSGHWWSLSGHWLSLGGH
jgi:hypothetical protein